MVVFLAPGVAVLGKYTPRIWEDIQIKNKFAKVARKYKLVSCDSMALGGEVRGPERNLDIRNSRSNVNAWHRDGFTNEPWLCMVLWSNREQTEILLTDGKILKPKPCDILLVRNHSVWHKTPNKMSPDRWFFRLFVREPKWMRP